MDNDMFPKRANWQRSGKDEEKKGAAISPFMIGGSVVLLMIVAGVFLFGRPAPQLPVAVSATTATPLVATPTPLSATATPDCVAGSTYLEVILAQEAKNQWDVAAQNAATALTNTRLCQTDRQVLAQKYMADALEGLYGTTFPPDKASQQAAAQQYQSIQAHAHEYGISSPPALSIAHRAAQSGAFLLGLSAYDDAFAHQEFTVADVAIVHDYISLLYDVGYYWTENKGADYNQGLTFLATSYHLATVHHTGQAEAWGRLKALLGNDESKWPSPMQTPLN